MKVTFLTSSIYSLVAVNVHESVLCIHCEIMIIYVWHSRWWISYAQYSLIQILYYFQQNYNVFSLNASIFYVILIIIHGTDDITDFGKHFYWLAKKLGNEGSGLKSPDA